jgi:hypothetical protein
MKMKVQQPLSSSTFQWGLKLRCVASQGWSWETVFLTVYYLSHLTLAGFPPTQNLSSTSG